MTIKFTWKNECPIHKPTKCKSEESDDGLSDAIRIQNHPLKKKRNCVWSWYRDKWINENQRGVTPILSLAYVEIWSFVRCSYSRVVETFIWQMGKAQLSIHMK